MSVLLVETRSKKLTTQGTGDSHSNRASCEAHIAPSGTRGSYRASYEGETSSPDSEGSYFSYSSPVTRRMTNTVRSSNRGAILAVGEELRQLLHSEQPQIIKDRRYHLRTFEKSFVGHEMVDWLLKKGEVESRREAVAMMQKLLENGVIHHVCDDHDFKDEKLFFRFRRDDNTYEDLPDTAALAKGQRIYSRLRTDGSNLIQDRRYHLQSFKQCFIGRELVDWLITRGEVNTREDAVVLGTQLLEAGVFRHVCDDHHFKDEFLFFRFKNDDNPGKTFGRRLGVGSKKGKGKRSSDNLSPHGQVGSGDDISVGRDSLVSSESGEVTESTHDDEYVPMQSPDDPRYVEMHRAADTQSASSNNSSPLPVRQASNRPSVEELMDKSRFVQRQIEVVSDPVGYGFVIRGSRPVYVHNLDPSGPAASVGLMLGEYLYYCNGEYVLEKSHTDVARIILMGPSTASLVTLIEKERLQQQQAS